MGPLRKFRKDRNQTPLQRKRNASGRTIPPISPRATFLLFLSLVAFTALIALIAFAGLTPSDPQITRDQTAPERIVADFGFSYESDVLTQRRKALARERIPPSYRIDNSAYETFSQALSALEYDFAEFEKTHSDFEGEERDKVIRAFVEEANATSKVTLPVEPLVRFLSETSSIERNRIMQKALEVLQGVYRNGIVSEEDPNFTRIGSFNLMPVETGDGGITNVEIQRTYDAKVTLRSELAALETSNNLFESLFEIMAEGIQPNLEFDAEATQIRRDAAADRVEPVTVNVREGETIIEPGLPVSSLAYEKLLDYRQEQRARTSNQFFLDPTFQQQSLLALMIILAAVLALRLSKPGMAQDPRRLGTLALLILTNVAVFRILLILGGSEIFGGDHRILEILPFAAPLAFAPLTAGILLGPIAGSLAGFVIASIFAVMLGEAAFLFLAGFISILTGIFFCHNIRLRTNVVRASFMTGVTLAVFVVLHGILLDTSLSAISRQVAAALISASVTGVVILGILPLLERLFSFTTDITLLEYTDFNHPLLRRMQVEAPGTYHHSLMVASLAENAAAEIGANPLVCRACALFHDIGKMVKPEYFTENQRSGHNPLIEQKPSMSAVIIKRHVKEGVELARKFKLPKIFVDVIRQHHGTSLIQYFYQEAINRRERAQLPLFTGVRDEDVEETTYRYDGPKPDFVESAIIFFADSIEAASRSLKKVNAQSVDELLDKIFQGRIEDRQLDECPLTLQQVASIKKSFSRTLLNSLHSRIAYPPEEKPDNTSKPQEPATDSSGEAEKQDEFSRDPDQQQV